MMLLMALPSGFGPMEPDTKAIGSMGSHMEKENSYMQMETSMRVLGKREEPMALVFTFIMQGVNTKGFGKTTSNTDMAKRHGTMAMFMKELMKKDKKMGKELTNGKMVHIIQVHG